MSHFYLPQECAMRSSSVELQYYNIQQTDTVQESRETIRKFDFCNRYIDLFFFNSCFVFFANIKNVTMGYFRTLRCTLPAWTIQKQGVWGGWVHLGNFPKPKRHICMENRVRRRHMVCGCCALLRSVGRDEERGKEGGGANGLQPPSFSLSSERVRQPGWWLRSSCDWLLPVALQTRPDGV